MFLIKLAFTWSFFQVMLCGMPVLHRKIEKNGLHREIHTTIVVTNLMVPDIESEAEPTCQVIFRESIPSGAYIDPFQLASLKNFGGPDYLLTEHVDVEQQEYQARSFSLSIYGNLTSTQEGWKSGYVLPIHLRYHAISDGDFTTISFESPEVFLRCANAEEGGYLKGNDDQPSEILSAPCDSSNVQLCKWSRMKHETQSGLIQIHISVGIAQHYLLVTFGTLCATLLGCFSLGYKAVLSSRKKIS